MRKKKYKRKLKYKIQDRIERVKRNLNPCYKYGIPSTYREVVEFIENKIKATLKNDLEVFTLESLCLYKVVLDKIMCYGGEVKEYYETPYGGKILVWLKK
jgi:hypothetical protein